MATRTPKELFLNFFVHMLTQTPKTFFSHGDPNAKNFFFYMATQTPYTYFFFWTLPAEIFPNVKVMLNFVSIFLRRAQLIFFNLSL